MGAKARVIPGFLDRVLAAEAAPGSTVVDLMSGTGVVAAYCARNYRVFTNDVQHYSQVIASSLIEHDPRTKGRFLRSVDLKKDLHEVYEANRLTLDRRYSRELAAEEALLERYRTGDSDIDWCRDYRSFLRDTVRLEEDATPSSEIYDADLMAQYRDQPHRRPACLVTNYYANVYFGLRQAIALDSLHAAIDDLVAADPFAERKRVHYLSALIHAASVSTSGTSHFAQPRHWRKDRELRAMAQRRCLDIWDVFEEYSAEILATVESIPYRQGNRAYAGDYRDRLAPPEWPDNPAQSPHFAFASTPDLIYLDPPYTADNYSRFYHLLEVLVRYDYPPFATNGRGRLVRGRYPAIVERFQSGFCSAQKVEEEFRQVLSAAAATGSKLVISYAAPTGLLLKQYVRQDPHADPLKRFRALCKEAYRRASVKRRAMMHSGQGDSNLKIEELLLVCSEPRV